MDTLKCKAPAGTGARETIHRTASIADVDAGDKAFAMLLFHLGFRSFNETTQAFRSHPDWGPA